MLKLITEGGVSEILVTKEFGLQIMTAYNFWKQQSGTGNPLFISPDLTFDFGRLIGLGIVPWLPPAPNQDISKLARLNQEMLNKMNQEKPKEKDDDDDEPWRRSLRPDEPI